MILCKKRQVIYLPLARSADPQRLRLGQAGRRGWRDKRLEMARGRPHTLPPLNPLRPLLLVLTWLPALLPADALASIPRHASPPPLLPALRAGPVTDAAGGTSLAADYETEGPTVSKIS